MTDVRQQLRTVIQDVAARRHEAMEAASSTDFADAILERFEVTPKPVVTVECLGVMAAIAHNESPSHTRAGQRMLAQLAKAGLKIVRVEDDE